MSLNKFMGSVSSEFRLGTLLLLKFLLRNVRSWRKKTLESRSVEAPSRLSRVESDWGIDTITSKSPSRFVEGGR